MLIDPQDIDRLRASCQQRVEEWLGNDVPEEGGEDYDRWRVMTAEVEAIECLQDALDFIGGDENDAREYLERCGITSD